MRFERVQLRRVERSARGGAAAFDWGGWLSSENSFVRSELIKEEDAVGHGAWVRAVAAPAVAVPAGEAAAELIVKARPLRRPIEMLKVAMGVSRGARQWNGAVWLRTRGFATARPLVLATAELGSVPHEVLVIERLRGPTLLDLLVEGGVHVRTQHAIAHEVGRHIGLLALCGRHNRDGKPSNLIVLGTTAPGLEDPQERDAIRIAPIDTVAIRWILGSARGEVERMLARLYIEPLGCGAPPRRSLCLRAVLAALREHGHGPPGAAPARGAKRVGARPEFRNQVRRCWGRLVRLVGAHGDPTPRVTPHVTPRARRAPGR